MCPVAQPTEPTEPTEPSQRDRQRLSRWAHGPVERLGSGVEGTVYRLRPGTVAKVWRSKSAAELEQMSRLYADVDAARLAVLTPLIHEVATVDGVTVTIERELPGAALPTVLDATSARLPDRTVDAVATCLEALASVPGTDAVRAPAVLGETAPFRTRGDTFPRALLALLERRLETGEPHLVAALPDFRSRYANLQAGLAGLESGPDTVVHGDLFGDNIHVGPAGEPVAILDFGFMTTAGDPRFDAGVTAGIMNMYGEHAASTTETLTRELARRLGYDPDVLALYRVAYAVATCTLFGTDLADGHFRWCVAQIAGL
jgi:aminoglycoside phosphotransferase (APT) family kinase protein